MHPAPTIELLFREELKRRNIPFLRAEEGVFVISLSGTECSISLENIERTIARDSGGTEAIASFVEGLLATQIELPDWPQAEPGIRLSLEASDYEFGTTIYHSISKGAVRVLVYTDPDEHRISWLTSNHLLKWHVSEAALQQVANRNMNDLLSRTTLEIKKLGMAAIGLLSTHSVFKASLLLCSDLREFVAPLGWPVFGVAPCRDFAYLFSDESLIPKLGTVVMHEFQGSGYPITSEVLEISDKGVRAVGAYGA
jgi:hypothetical protein